MTVIFILYLNYRILKYFFKGFHQESIRILEYLITLGIPKRLFINQIEQKAIIRLHF